jgi:hypothetical protein
MIPLILGAIAVVSAVAGVGAGAVGMSDMNEAKEIGEDAQELYEDAVDYLNVYWEDTNGLAEEYGQYQMDVMISTIGRFVDFIERNIGKAKQSEAKRSKAKQSEKKFLEGPDSIYSQEIKEYKTALEAEQFFKGGFMNLTFHPTPINLVVGRDNFHPVNH